MALRQELNYILHSPQRVLPKAPQKHEVVSTRNESKKSTPALSELFTELISLTDSTARKKLIFHQLTALVKEMLRVPFHSSARVIKKENTDAGLFKLEMHDSLYAASSVLDRCQRAIDAAWSKNQIAEALRYTLEKQQVETFQALLAGAIPELALPLIHSISQENPIISFLDQQFIIENLLATDWNYAQGLISEEVAWQLDVKPDTSCLVGPKFLDIMTKSSVHKHKGWKTMFNLSQPAYLPEYNMWIVLYDQHMADADWDEYDELLKTITPNTISSLPPYLTKKTNFLGYEKKSDREARVMSACVQLGSEYQTKQPVSVFIDLLYKHKPHMASSIYKKQNQLLALYEQLKTTFPLHIDYLLQIVKIESNWEINSEPSETQKQRFFQAFFITLSSLYHQQIVNSKQLQHAINSYASLYADPVNREKSFELASAYRLASATTLPFVLLKVESVLECTLLSAPSMMLSMSRGSWGSLLNKAQLSRTELIHLVGEKRAKDWSIGICQNRNCHNHLKGSLVDIGECGLCKVCEFGPTLKALKSKSSSELKKNSSDTIPPKISQPFIAQQSESFGDFLARVI